MGLCQNILPVPSEAVPLTANTIICVGSDMIELHVDFVGNLLEKMVLVLEGEVLPKYGSTEEF